MLGFWGWTVTEKRLFLAFLQDPLFGRPGDQSFDDLWDQEQHHGAAEVLAHGFHISSLKFYCGNSHKEGGGGDYRRGQTGSGTRILQQILILHCKSSRLRRDAGSSDPARSSIRRSEER